MTDIRPSLLAMAAKYIGKKNIKLINHETKETEIIKLTRQEIRLAERMDKRKEQAGKNLNKVLDDFIKSNKRH